MGNILRKIVRKKKQQEKLAYENHIYATWTPLPDYLWTDEVREIIVRRNNEQWKQIGNFLNEFKSK
jgi:hypothetical protein